MTSVIRSRYVVQVFSLRVVGLLAMVVVVGCTPPATEQAPPATTTPATTTPAAAAVGRPAEDAVGEDATAQEAAIEREPAPDIPVEETPGEDEPGTDMPLKDAPAEDTPGEDIPAADAPAEKASGENTQAEDAAAEEEFNPTFVATPVWLPEPIGVPESAAKEEAEMNPYTEEIPRTDVTFDMVPIPGGKFTMGSPEDEADRNEDEGPRHEVVIEPFWMGKCEVTWEEYELWGVGLDQQRREITGVKSTERDKLVDAVAQPTKPYSDMTFGMGKDGYPAICMAQLAARTYCKWLSAKTGRYYRLPTEAEWEYACRAATSTAYYFGDDPDELDDYAWHFENGDDQYHKVGRKKPNPWGLYDMHGNVSEWVLDQYIPDYYQQFVGNTTRRPLAVPTTLFSRVARGGCWDDDPDKLRSAARTASNEDWNMQDPQIPQSIWYHTEVYCPGFRVVRPLRVPDVEEAKLYEPDYEAIKEYREAQAGKE